MKLPESVYKATVTDVIEVLVFQYSMESCYQHFTKGNRKSLKNFVVSCPLSVEIMHLSIFSHKEEWGRQMFASDLFVGPHPRGLDC